MSEIKKDKDDGNIILFIMSFLSLIGILLLLLKLYKLKTDERRLIEPEKIPIEPKIPMIHTQQPQPQKEKLILKSF